MVRCQSMTSGASARAQAQCPYCCLGTTKRLCSDWCLCPGTAPEFEQGLSPSLYSRQSCSLCISLCCTLRWSYTTTCLARKASCTEYHGSDKIVVRQVAGKVTTAVICLAIIFLFQLLLRKKNLAMGKQINKT